MSSVSEIKEKAKATAQRVRGASASSLLRSAQEKAVHAAELESQGDIIGALRDFFIAAHLSKFVYETPEFKGEQSTRKGPLWKQVIEFQQVCSVFECHLRNLTFLKQYGNDLIPRTHRLEAKLKELERVKVR